LLAQRLDYRNSFLDRGLRVDIVDPPEDLLGHFDFLIAADVFPHVAAPVQRAFDGARRLLRPGGLLLLTVPYDPGAPTLEHFEGLRDLDVREEAGRRRLHARAADGSEVLREDLVFHGGEGFTLEMRRFGLQDLLAHCRQAGFDQVAVEGDEVPERGIRWQPWSQPLSARVPHDR
jgi:SAM-dependent methyltransferase